MAPVFGEIASTSVGGVSPTPTWRPAIITTTIIAHNPAIHQSAVSVHWSPTSTAVEVRATGMYA